MSSGHRRAQSDDSPVIGRLPKTVCGDGDILLIAEVIRPYEFVNRVKQSRIWGSEG